MALLPGQLFFEYPRKQMSRKALDYYLHIFRGLIGELIAGNNEINAPGI